MLFIPKDLGEFLPAPVAFLCGSVGTVSPRGAIGFLGLCGAVMDSCPWFLGFPRRGSQESSSPKLGEHHALPQQQKGRKAFCSQAFNQTR